MDSTESTTEEDDVDGRRKGRHINYISRSMVKDWKVGNNRKLVKLTTRYRLQRPTGNWDTTKPHDAIVGTIGNFNYGEFPGEELAHFKQVQAMYKYCRPVGYSFYAKKAGSKGLWVSKQLQTAEGRTPYHPLGNPVPIRVRVRLAPQSTNTIVVPTTGQVPSAAIFDVMNNVVEIPSNKFVKVKRFIVPNYVKTGHGLQTAGFDIGTESIETLFNQTYPQVVQPDYFTERMFWCFELMEPNSIPVTSNNGLEPLSYEGSDQTYVAMFWVQDVQFIVTTYWEFWGDTLTTS